MNIPDIKEGYPVTFVSGTGKQHYLNGDRAGRYVRALCWLWLDREVSLAVKSYCKKCERAKEFLERKV